MPIVVLVISVVGVPWAIRRTIEWAFFKQLIVLDGANSTPAATAGSAAAVRGRRTRTGLTLLLLAFLVGVVPPLIGVILMVRSSLPLAWITSVSGLLTAAILPFAVIGATVFYRGLHRTPRDA